MSTLSFCQSDPPMSESFWQKDRIFTHILFDLCLFEHFTQSQVLVTSLYLSVNKLQTIYRNSNSKLFKFAQKEMRGSCSICNQTYYQL